MAAERIKKIVKYIRDNFDHKTRRNQFYNLGQQRVSGFNSIIAVGSIPMAIAYYQEFKRQLEASDKPLRVATIYSYSPNEGDELAGLMPDESMSTESLDRSSRDFLESAIRDYNGMFATNFSTEGKSFENYYKDLSQRVKDREVDILIVVNMFLTGFDATTLNTLWVDKNLRQHGLIQAFSRTNRILNTVKNCGNIVCFRDLVEETDQAIALFGDKDAKGIVLLKTYEEYYNGYMEGDKGAQLGYIDLISQLLTHFPLLEQIVGEENEKAFIRLFGQILRLRNILSSFDDFQGDQLLPDRDYQNYQSRYLDLRDKYRGTGPNRDKVDISDDIVFELELIRQVEVNIDYILMMVERYKESNCKDKEILATIKSAVDASIELRSKKELIARFIAQVNIDTDVRNDWQKYLEASKEEDLAELIKNENLKEVETRRFVDDAFRDGNMRTTGTALDNIMPAISLFSQERKSRKDEVIDKLLNFFDKYFGVA